MARLQILLIEDNADDAELIGWALADAGLDHRIHRVELRSELESALQHGDWSLVLCDSRLPGYSGIEALAWVRDSMPHVPFLFCTGGALADDAALAAAIPKAQGWVSKDQLVQLPGAMRAALARAQV